MSLHDKLQGQAYQWAHNTYPDIRGNFFAVLNEIHKKPGETEKDFVIRLSKLKAIGLRKGVLDLLLIVPNGVYGWDAKIKPDYLKPDQLNFVLMLRSCGGDGYAFYDLDMFKEQFAAIMDKHGHKPVNAEQRQPSAAALEQDRLRRLWIGEMKKSI